MYPTTAELVAASSVAALTDLETAKQDALRAEAITAVESFCRQSFTEEGTDDDPVTKTLDGAGGAVLYLPRRLERIIGLSVPEGSPLGVGDVALNDDGDRLAILAEPTGGSSWVTRAYADLRSLPALDFPVGPGSVGVAGVWGWPAPPDAVVTALRFDMEDRALANAHALAETVRSARALGLTAVDQGGLSIALGGREPEVSTRVARQLADLVWESAAGALA